MDSLGHPGISRYLFIVFTSLVHRVNSAADDFPGDSSKSCSPVTNSLEGTVDLLIYLRYVTDGDKDESA